MEGQLPMGSADSSDGWDVHSFLSNENNKDCPSSSDREIISAKFIPRLSSQGAVSTTRG